MITKVPIPLLFFLAVLWEKGTGTNGIKIRPEMGTGVSMQ